MVNQKSITDQIPDKELKINCIWVDQKYAGNIRVYEVVKDGNPNVYLKFPNIMYREFKEKKSD